MTTTFHASRDSANARTDEDSAMAHASIASGESFAEVRDALVGYMTNEVDWLTTSRYRSAQGLRRAADILEAANDRVRYAKEEDLIGNRFSVEAAGLTWQITRNER